MSTALLVDTFTEPGASWDALWPGTTYDDLNQLGETSVRTWESNFDVHAIAEAVRVPTLHHTILIGHLLIGVFVG